LERKWENEREERIVKVGVKVRILHDGFTSILVFECSEPHKYDHVHKVVEFG